MKSTETNCRQLFHRAKDYLHSARPRSTRTREQKRQLAERFVSAMRAGDGTGSHAFSPRMSVSGATVAAAFRRRSARSWAETAVVHLLLGIRRAATASGIGATRVSTAIVEVNYEPAMLVRVDGRVDSVYVCSIVEETIVSIRVIRNPDKLAYLARQLNAAQPSPGESSRTH